MRKLPSMEWRGFSRVRVVAAVLLLLFTVVTARWMVSPFDDWVPLVLPQQLPAGIGPGDLPTAAHYRCSAPFAGHHAASITEQAGDALELQTLSRKPCDEVWPQRRVLALTDLVIALGLFVALAVWSFRPEPTDTHARRSHYPDPRPAMD
ncbi:MAG: hypothetical protein HYR89_02725 [Actinobacteria bacterium]|nr:hypothetical protein [Actinomycetota bacterium]